MYKKKAFSILLVCTKKVDTVPILFVHTNRMLNAGFLVQKNFSNVVYQNTGLALPLLTKSYGDANGFKQKLANDEQFHQIESNRIEIYHQIESFSFLTNRPSLLYVKIIRCHNRCKNMVQVEKLHRTAYTARTALKYS